MLEVQGALGTLGALGAGDAGRADCSGNLASPVSYLLILAIVHACMWLVICGLVGLIDSMGCTEGSYSGYSGGSGGSPLALRRTFGST